MPRAVSSSAPLSGPGCGPAAVMTSPSRWISSARSRSTSVGGLQGPGLALAQPASSPAAWHEPFRPLGSMGLPVGVTGSVARSAPLREPVADRQSRHLAPGRWSPRDLRGGVAPGPRRRRRGQSPVKWSLAAGHHRSVVNLVVKKREPIRSSRWRRAGPHPDPPVVSQDGQHSTGRAQSARPVQAPAGNGRQPQTPVGDGDRGPGRPDSAAGCGPSTWGTAQLIGWDLGGGGGQQSGGAGHTTSGQPVIRNLVRRYRAWNQVLEVSVRLSVPPWSICPASATLSRASLEYRLPVL